MKNPEYRSDVFGGDPNRMHTLYAISVYLKADLSGGEEYHCYVRNWAYHKGPGFVPHTTRVPAMALALGEEHFDSLCSMADKINEHLGYTAAVVVFG